MICSPVEIRIDYMRSWFIIDFMSILPIDIGIKLFYHTSGFSNFSGIKLIKLNRMSRMIKLLRLNRVMVYLKGWEDYFHIRVNTLTHIFQIIGKIFGLLLVCHITGCLQYLVPRLLEFPEDSWVAIRGINRTDVHFLRKYSWSLFK